MPRGFLVKLQVTDLAITGETGQCKGDKLVISDVYATLGQDLSLLYPLSGCPSFGLFFLNNPVPVCLLEKN